MTTQKPTGFELEVHLKEIPDLDAVIVPTLEGDYEVDYYTCPHCKNPIDPDNDPLILRIVVEDGMGELRKCPHCGRLYKNTVGFREDSMVSELSFKANVSIWRD